MGWIPLGNVLTVLVVKIWLGMGHAPGILWADVQDAPKDPAIHGIAPHNNEISGVLRLRNSSLMYILISFCFCSFYNVRFLLL